MMPSEKMVNMEIILDDDVLLKLALEAHRKDMKLNDYLIEILLEYCDEQQRDIEPIKS